MLRDSQYDPIKSQSGWHRSIAIAETAATRIVKTVAAMENARMTLIGHGIQVTSSLTAKLFGGSIEMRVESRNSEFSMVAKVAFSRSGIRKPRIPKGACYNAPRGTRSSGLEFVSGSTSMRVSVLCAPSAQSTGPPLSARTWRGSRDRCRLDGISWNRHSSIPAGSSAQD